MKIMLPLLAIAIALPGVSVAQDAKTYPPCSASVKDGCTETGRGMGTAHHRMTKKSSHKKHHATMTKKTETKPMADK